MSKASKAAKASTTTSAATPKPAPPTPTEPKPYFVIAKEVWDRLWAYVDLMPGEVGCFGYVTVHEGGMIYVEDAFLVPQESDASQVDFIESGLPYAIDKAASEGKLDQLKFCWHSHAMHGAYFSSTDHDMIRKVGRTSDWFASVVFNKKGETIGQVDTFHQSPFGRRQTTLDKLDVLVERDPTWEDSLVDELEHFVKEPPKPTFVSTYKGNKPYEPKPVKGSGMVHVTKGVKAEIAKVKPGEIEGALDFDDLEWLAEEIQWSSIDQDGVRYWFDAAGEVTAAGMIPAEAKEPDPLDQQAWNAFGVGAYS